MHVFPSPTPAAVDILNFLSILNYYPPMMNRYAMLGFLTAVLVEASTGEGILGQVLEICKWSGLLGDRSGF